MRAPTFHHAGLVVPNIEVAMAELENALGITWSPIVENAFGQWAIRVAFSHQGPPHVELVEGPPGSPWDSTGGPRLDHLGYWTDDVDRDASLNDALGFFTSFDPRPSGRRVVYQDAPASGLRVELMNAANRAAFEDRFNLSG